jgi:hypothetical protein
MRDVRFGSKADICSATGHVRFTSNSDRKSGLSQKVGSAFPSKAGIPHCAGNGQMTRQRLQARRNVLPF